jgi:predicted nucleotidyltransferase component of viral defense system
MITRQAIIAWQENAPWINMHQVEQDLIISRALVAIYSDSFLASRLAFRGGTALHRVYLPPPARYSEDIDLVQTVSEPIGAVIDRLRETLGFLGAPIVKQKKSNNTLLFKVGSTYPPETHIKLKVEINCTEHFTVHGFTKKPYEMASPWFSGQCAILTYGFNELLGTKIRALYQRRKGRDLLDLFLASKSPSFDPDDAVSCFKQYIAFSDGNVPTGKKYEENLQSKLNNRLFVGDTEGLLRTGIAYDSAQAFDIIKSAIIDRI